MSWRSAQRKLLHSVVASITPTQHDLDVIIRRAVLYNRNWQKVAEGFQEYSPLQCQLLFEKHFKGLAKQTKWTDMDASLLTRRVMLYGKDWEKVSQGLDKSPDECQEQWNIQSPDSEWTLTEMQAFWRGFHASKDWDAIAEHVPSRSANECQAFHKDYAYLFGERRDILQVDKQAEWTLDHTRRLRALLEQTQSPDWSELGRRFGMSSRQLRLKIVQPSRRPWSKKEKDDLAKLVKSHGTKWSIISQHMPGRTPNQCSLQYHGRASKSPRTPFTATERLTLTTAVEQAGSQINWTEIAKLVPGRTPAQCRIAAHTQLGTQGAWTEHEDSLLRQAIEIYGAKAWSNAAAMIPGRNPLQCRMRWLATDPSVSTGPFPTDEVLQLITLVGRHGFKWAKVAQDLGTGRNGKQLELKFRWLLRKQKYPGDIARQVYKTIKERKHAELQINTNVDIS